MKLEWRKIPARFRFADCEFGQYRIAGRAGIRRKLHIELCDGRTLDDDSIIHDVPTARQICQDDYDARVAQIAAANGYVKLEPGQVVVQAELLEAVIADMRNDCDCSEGYCNNECGGGNCHVKDLTAALDASGVGR